jgi:hypothetical protein
MLATELERSTVAGGKLGLGWKRWKIGVRMRIMKRIASFVLILLVALVPLRAQSSATPEDCIRGFYHWYVTNLVANRNPMKQRNEIRRYASERLLKEIGKMKTGPDGLDGDYFVDAQDFDPLWAKNIAISAVHINGDKANARVVLDGAKGMRKNLLVDLVRENGTWKVDKVQGRDGAG